VGLKVLIWKGSFFHFRVIFLVLGQKLNFKNRAFSGNPSNFRFPNTCFPWFRIADDVLPMRDTICEFSRGSILEVGNGPQKGTLTGRRRDPPGRPLCGRPGGSPSRTDTTVIQGRFQYRVNLLVDGVLKWSLGCPHIVSAETSLGHSLYNPISTGTSCKYRDHPTETIQGHILQIQRPSRGCFCKYRHILTGTFHGPAS
jgi:hypothetical protein